MHFEKQLLDLCSKTHWLTDKEIGFDKHDESFLLFDSSFYGNTTNGLQEDICEVDVSSIDSLVLMGWRYDYKLISGP